MAQPLQVFVWGPQSHVGGDGKTHYSSFTLNGTEYRIGDSVYLFPESEHQPHYIGRIVAAFVDDTSGHTDPHSVRVKWYERRVNLEESTRGIEESEREVFELEDEDVNPIGCISGKNYVIKARGYDEALQRMQGSDADWFFCRGFFLQSSNAFQPYSAVELGEEGGEDDLGAVQSATPSAIPAQPPVTRQAHMQPHASEPAAPKADKLKRGVPGRACVQCGATQTPQWREGPTGPKTLCNACGVRYGRAQAKAQKRAAGAAPGASGGRAANVLPAGAAAATSAGTSGSPPPRSRKRGHESAQLPVAAAPAEPVVVHTRTDHRPLRQAAQAALARTAAYALTGEFPDADDEVVVQYATAQAPSATTGSVHSSQARRPAENGGGGDSALFALPQDELPIAALDLQPVSRPASLAPGPPAALGGGSGGVADLLPAGSKKARAAVAVTLSARPTPDGACSQPPHPFFTLPLTLPARLSRTAAPLQASLRPPAPGPGCSSCSVTSMGDLPLAPPLTGTSTMVRTADDTAAELTQLMPPPLLHATPLGVASFHVPHVHTAPPPGVVVEGAQPAPPGSATSSAHHAPAMSPVTGACPPRSFTTVADKAVRYLPELKRFEPLFVGLDAMPPDTIPGDAARALEAVRGRLDAAAAEADAAGAALLSAAEAHAACQAEAEVAAAAVACAGRELRMFLGDLLRKPDVSSLTQDVNASMHDGGTAGLCVQLRDVRAVPASATPPLLVV